MGGCCVIRRIRALGTAIAFAGCLAAVTSAATNESSPVGATVADFSLSSHRGREWSLGDCDDSAVVLVFLGTECPLAKLYAPRLAQLHEQFAAESVAFVGVCANKQDSMTELTAFVERHGIRFPVLKDVGNRLADELGATRLTEVYLLDSQRVVRYHGRIDDQYGVGFSRDQATRMDLVEALQEVLAGREVSVAETEASGCHIGRVKEIVPHGDVTYTRDIAAILNRRCVECHRPGEIAPFSLAEYEDVVGWEDTIMEVIEDRRMPPWFANPAHGDFRNDARLGEEEKQLLFTWLENGMPEGDPNDLPDPPRFAEGWRMPEPDQVVFATDEPFQVPAEGVVDYQYFVVDPGWTEDRYVAAAECRPGNSAVVHHIIAYLLGPGEEPDAKRRSMLVGYAPGSPPTVLPDGVAMHVPAGSRLLMEMHYTPNGSTQTDHSYVGFKFAAEKDVKRRLQGRAAINTKFRIPPRTSNYEVSAEYVARQDELLLDLTPHMHLRGKAFRYEAIYPDGTEEVLLDVPAYDFNWQLTYELAEPKTLPAGTKILCTAHFDNSEGNLVNPDPDSEIGWGQQSWNEMMIGFFNVVEAAPAGAPARSVSTTTSPLR